MEIVLQGPKYPETQQIIDNFLLCDFVEHVIFSTWKGTWGDEVFSDSRILTIFSDDVDSPGIGNRNRQIKSTQAGLEMVKSDICAKFRTDQIFPPETLKFMNEFYSEHEDRQKIFTLGLYKNWPFHPRDHMFWGPTDKMKMLFDCPYDLDGEHADYNAFLRAEAWLGAHYAAKHDPQVAEMVKDYRTYLTDNAPKRDEAFALHDKYYHKLFYPFPRIQYSWPKIGLNSYYYDYTKESWSEYWHEEIGEINGTTETSM